MATSDGEAAITVPAGFRRVVPPLSDSHLSLLSEASEASVRLYVVPKSGRGTLEEYSGWWLQRMRDGSPGYEQLERRELSFGGRQAIQVVARYRQAASGHELQNALTFIEEPSCYLYVSAFAHPDRFDFFRERLLRAAESAHIVDSDGR